ncbi:MAG: DUF5677 domain-containing protein [Pseudomonadota bacterium]
MGVSASPYLNRDGLFVGFLISMTELAGAILALEANQCPIAVPPVFRALVEEYIHLENLKNFPDYQNQLYFDYHLSWTRMIRPESAGMRMLGEIAASDGFQEKRAAHNQQLQELKKEGYSDLPLERRFARVDQAHLYDGLYRPISQDAHPGIQHILSSTVDRDEDTFVLYGREESSRHLIMGAASLLVAGHEIVQQYLATKEASRQVA